jgi:ABC-type uncharacterized transport system substrate-binding protein
MTADAGNPFSKPEVDEVQAAARTLGLSIALSEIRRVEDIAPAFDVIKGRAEASGLPSTP